LWPVLAVAIATSLVVGPTSAALAAWSLPGSGFGAAAAATMPSGTAPTASVSARSVTLNWTAANMSNSTAVAGYVVNRYSTINGTKATVGSGCSGVIAATTCTELNVPAGTWYYTETPVQLSWTGTESTPSNTVTLPPT
jgi:hypothetical protein